MAALPEVIVICIDNSGWIEPGSTQYNAQLDAIKIYCQAKFEAHPDTVVSLYTMSAGDGFHLFHPPTGSLDKIVAHFPCIQPGAGALDLFCALSLGPLPLVKWIGCPNKQLRMLFFIGGLAHLNSNYVEDIGKAYKERGIAVDIVDFFQGEIPICYEFVRNDLEAFFKSCNCDDNSHIVRVEDASLISVALSKSILKKTLSLSKGKKNQRGNVYGKHIHPFEEGDDCRGLKQILTLSPIA